MPKGTPDEKRRLFVCLLLVLSVRSWALLDFFSSKGTSLSLDTARQLYDLCVQKKNMFPGLDLNRRSRQAHTSEQKLWSIGFLMDSFLFPYLCDKHCFDQFLDLDAESFVREIKGIKLVQGALLKGHVAEYLIVAGLMAAFPDDGNNARNSQKFLDMCGIASWEEVLRQIRDHVVFEINWRDCSSSACMVIRLLESLCGGSTKGKGYKEELSAKRSELYKALPDYLSQFACCTGPATARQEKRLAFLYAGELYMTASFFCRNCSLSSCARAGKRKSPNYAKGEMLVVLVPPTRLGHHINSFKHADAFGSPIGDMIKQGPNIRSQHLKGCAEERFTLMLQLQAMWRVLSLHQKPSSATKKAKLL